MSLVPLISASSFSPLLDSAHVWVMQLSPLAALWLAIMGFVAFVGVVRLLIRGFQLRGDASADIEFLEDYTSSEQPLAIYLAHRLYKTSPSYRSYQRTVKELCLHLVGAHTVNSELVNRLRAAGRISPTQMDSIRQALNSTTSKNHLLGLQKRVGDGSGITLLSLGSAGTCILAMEQSLMNNVAWHAIPTLLPLTVAVLAALIIKLWQLSHDKKVLAAQIRFREFAAALSADLDRLFVDHRRPLDSLPSLATMSFADGPSFSQSPAEKPPSRSA